MGYSWVIIIGNIWKYMFIFITIHIHGTLMDIVAIFIVTGEIVIYIH
jgi:hypothetical protein